MGFGSTSHRKLFYLSLNCKFLIFSIDIMDRYGRITKYGEPGDEFKYDYARENRRGRYCSNGMCKL